MPEAKSLPFVLGLSVVQRHRLMQSDVGADALEAVAKYPAKDAEAALRYAKGLAREVAHIAAIRATADEALNALPGVDPGRKVRIARRKCLEAVAGLDGPGAA